MRGILVIFRFRTVPYLQEPIKKEIELVPIDVPFVRIALHEITLTLKPDSVKATASPTSQQSEFAA
jgi:hypothetical protein